jgi:hypothetical protein
MIYCVWYPSGGFGHFINGILTLYGDGFKRPSGKIKFSKTGDSHNLDLVAPKYTGVAYDYEFDTNFNYSVLVDQGINSNNREFVQLFSGAKIIKICYTDTSWPVVARTMIDKAMKSSIEVELAVDSTLWSSTEPWAQREKYFLFLRDHSLRFAWRPEKSADCVFIDSLLDYNNLKFSIEKTGIKLNDFRDLWNSWYSHNKRYLDPIDQATQILEKIEYKENIDLTNITDTWAQAVIYYYIWLEYNKEVPHNDFKNFFKDTDQITAWLNQ